MQTVTTEQIFRQCEEYLCLQATFPFVPISGLVQQTLNLKNGNTTMRGEIYFETLLLDFPSDLVSAKKASDACFRFCFCILSTFVVNVLFVFTSTYLKISYTVGNISMFLKSLFLIKN